MKFEINVKNNEKLQKLALVKKIAHILGMNMFAAKVSTADKIFKLLESGVASASIIVDSEITEMEPLFSIQKDMPLFQDEELGITIKLVSEPEGLNLCELLKDCIGMKFYMPLFGVAVLDYITIAPGGNGILSFTVDNGKILVLRSDGKYCDGGELSVFPSKEQRDWSLFQPPWVPKQGERVWVKDTGTKNWHAAYFIEKDESKFLARQYPQSQNGGPWDECVPFEPIPW